MPATRSSRNQSRITLRRPYLDWVILAFRRFCEEQDNEWIPIKLLGEAVVTEAREINIALGQRYLTGIITALCRLERHGLVTFKDEIQTVVEIENSVKLTDRGLRLWSGIPSIDHEEGASRRKKDDAQRECIAEFKALEKIGKARTTAQLHRECRDNRRTILTRSRTIRVGQEVDPIPVASDVNAHNAPSREASVQSDASFISAATSPPSEEFAAYPSQVPRYGTVTPATPPRARPMGSFNSYSSLPTPGSSPGLGNILENVNMEVHERQHPHTVSHSGGLSLHPLPRTPAPSKEPYSLQNPYLTPVSTARPAGRARINAEAGPSSRLSDPGPIQWPCITRIWHGFMRFFPTGYTTPDTVEGVLTAIENRLEESENNLTAALRDKSATEVARRKAIDDWKAATDLVAELTAQGVRKDERMSLLEAHIARGNQYFQRIILEASSGQQEL